MSEQKDDITGLVRAVRARVPMDAAQMLAKAGYLEDARNLYNGLLSATQDPAQQAVLQHDLQQLMLLPAKPNNELH